MSKINHFLLLVILVNLSWANETTIDSSSQQETTVETAVNEIKDEYHATHSWEEPEQSNTEGQTQVSKPIEHHTCSAAGILADSSNCHIYHECSESTDGSLQLQTKSCPEREAFNPKLLRCSRDISSCEPDVHCSSKGVIADPETDKSYYLCQPHFDGSGFHIFRVYCGKNEVFFPTLHICFTDQKDLLTNGLTGVSDTLDIIAVKREILQIKREYKQQLKHDKEVKKTQEKLEKQREKEALQARKLEAANYKCETEGNFPSEVADNYYIACINSKNKISAIPLQCSLGAKFDPKTGTCEKGIPGEPKQE